MSASAALLAAPRHRRHRAISPATTVLLTWGGLRGGLAIAMALSLPAGPEHPSRNLIVAATYAVVVFSVLVQGMTLGPVFGRFMRKELADVPVPPATIHAGV